LLAVPVALALVGLAGCGDTLDTKKIAKGIKTSIERDDPGTRVVSVKCPGNRPLKKGDTFKCHVGAAPGQEADAKVVQLDKKGHVHYTVP